VHSVNKRLSLFFYGVKFDGFSPDPGFHIFRG
jgi:hypothetical protein